MVLTREDRQEIANLMKTTLDTYFLQTDIIDKIAETLRQKITTQLEDNNKIVSELKQECKQLHDKCDSLEQYSRRNNIRIFGLEETPNEINIEEKMVNLFTVLNITSEHIDRCHRAGPKVNNKHRPILIKFVNYKHKAMVLKNKRMFNGVKIKEDLTRTRNQLFYKAIEKYGYKNVWTSNGNIAIKMNNSTHFITNMQELNALS